MPTFILLGKFTKEGIATIKDSEQRIKAAKKLNKSLGGTIKAIYHTLGRYDLVAIVEGPSIESTMKALMITAGVGAIRTETLVAISTEDFIKIVNDLP